jgi:hypothetical protein
VDPNVPIEDVAGVKELIDAGKVHPLGELVSRDSELAGAAHWSGRPGPHACRGLWLVPRERPRPSSQRSGWAEWSAGSTRW